MQEETTAFKHSTTTSEDGYGRSKLDAKKKKNKKKYTKKSKKHTKKSSKKHVKKAKVKKVRKRKKRHSKHQESASKRTKKEFSGESTSSDDAAPLQFSDRIQHRFLEVKFHFYTNCFIRFMLGRDE